MFRRAFQCFLATLALTMVSTSASADSSPNDLDIRLLAACEAVAEENSAVRWFCLDGKLTYVTLDDVRAARGPSVAVLPPVPASAQPSTSDDDQAAAAAADDYDSWCETGSVCTRYPNGYISETKGNAAYGNQNGAIGSFDIILKVYLNGRQPQWITKFDHDTGPSLNFSNMYVNCVKDQTFDGSCGHHLIGGDGAFAISPYPNNRYNAPTIYNNVLTQSDDYFGTITGRFTPTGYGLYTMGTLRSPNFNCFGTGNCYFPNA